MKQINVFNRSVFLKDIIIASLIVVLPFLFYLYKLVPDIEVWDTPFFNIQMEYYADAHTFFWTLFSKILVVLLLAVWFITSKHWWRIVILIPLTIELFKLSQVVNDKKRFINEFEFIHSLPLTIPIIVFLFFVAKKLNYYSQSINTSSELDKEINTLLTDLSMFKTENFKTIKEELKQLRDKKEKLSKEEYLRKLIELRNNLTQL